MPGVLDFTVAVSSAALRWARTNGQPYNSPRANSSALSRSSTGPVNPLAGSMVPAVSDEPLAPWRQ